MKLLPLPKKIATCIYCVEDKSKRWIGLTKNYYRCFQQFSGTGKIDVSDEATFQVLAFVPSETARKTAELMCMEFGAKMLPKRKTRKIIRTDYNGVDIPFDNIIEAAAALNTTPGIIRRRIEDQQYFEAYKFRYAND